MGRHCGRELVGVNAREFAFGMLSLHVRGVKSGLISVLLLFSGITALQANWPQWRGPNRDGSVADFEAPSVWPETLKQVWRVETGEGWSSPILADGRVFLHSRIGDEEIVSCFAADSGELIWEDRYAAPGSVHPAGDDHGIGPKSTPAAAGDKVYTLGIGSILTCYESATGEIVWRKNYADRFPKPAPSCGTSMSPLIIDGMCVVHVGVDREGELLALDAANGEERWKYDGDGPGYGSLVEATLNGKRQLVAPVSRFMVGLTVDSGELIWRREYPTQSSQNILTPVIFNEQVIVGGIGNTTAAWQLKDGEMEPAWENTRAPLHMSSLTRAGGRIFGLTKLKMGQLFCADAKTGEVIWSSDGKFSEFATIVQGGEHVIVLTGDGQLIFLRTDADNYEPVATYEVSDNRSWTVPVVAGSRVLIKDENSLTCWSLTQ